MTKLHSMLLASAAAVVAGLGTSVSAQAADQLLTGAIASSAGSKLDGVVVSAKREGSNITTSVYTDATGNYYFPPMAAGKYKVWAQTLGFEQTKTDVDLQATKHQDLLLQLGDVGFAAFGHHAHLIGAIDRHADLQHTATLIDREMAHLGAADRQLNMVHFFVVGSYLKIWSLVQRLPQTLCLESTLM